MTNFQREMIIGQILGDAHIEKVTKNCRLSFSFGTAYQEYADWIHNNLQDFCSNGVYSISSQVSSSNSHRNYRLKTMTLPIFTEYHNLFYKYNVAKKRYVKVVPTTIVETMSGVVLAHFIMGDGSYGKDGRVRIFTNNYTYRECILLSEAITNQCNIECRVLFDRLGKDGNKQFILTIGKKQLDKLQSYTKDYMHHSMLYRIGL